MSPSINLNLSTNPLFLSVRLSYVSRFYICVLSSLVSSFPKLLAFLYFPETNPKFLSNNFSSSSRSSKFSSCAEHSLLSDDSVRFLKFSNGLYNYLLLLSILSILPISFFPICEYSYNLSNAFILCFAILNP